MNMDDDADIQHEDSSAKDDPSQVTKKYSVFARSSNTNAENRALQYMTIPVKLLFYSVKQTFGAIPIALSKSKMFRENQERYEAFKKYDDRQFVYPKLIENIIDKFDRIERKLLEIPKYIGVPVLVALELTKGIAAGGFAYSIYFAPTMGIPVVVGAHAAAFIAGGVLIAKENIATRTRKDEGLSQRNAELKTQTKDVENATRETKRISEIDLDNVKPIVNDDPHSRMERNRCRSHKRSQELVENREVNQLAF